MYLTKQIVKCNKMYKWKDDIKHPGYEPELICAKANVDHIISGQGTAVSTFDHSATTLKTYDVSVSKYWFQCMYICFASDSHIKNIPTVIKYIDNTQYSIIIYIVLTYIHNTPMRVDIPLYNIVCL